MAFATGGPDLLMAKYPLSPQGSCCRFLETLPASVRTPLLVQGRNQAGHMALSMAQQVLAALHFCQPADGAVLAESQVVVDDDGIILKADSKAVSFSAWNRASSATHSAFQGPLRVLWS